MVPNWAHWQNLILTKGGISTDDVLPLRVTGRRLEKILKASGFIFDGFFLGQRLKPRHWIIF